MTTPPAVNSHRRIHSRGFTAIELMTVIAIISVLIALLLPAVQQAREAARRLQCSNNLMQIGLALHNYHHAHATFPPGTVNPTGPVGEKDPGPVTSWTVQLLPYLEQGNLYNLLQQSTHTEEEKELLQEAFVPSYHCSSSSLNRHNYAGCHHDVEAPIDADNQGVLFLNSRIRQRDLLDGRSSTIMIGEILSNDSWRRGTRSTLRNTSSINASADREDVIAARGQTDLYVDGENEEEANAAAGQIPPNLTVGGFASQHPGGAQFSFADGAVRFLSQSIDGQTFRWLGHRADGQVPGEF